MQTSLETQYLKEFDRYTEAFVDTFSAFDKAAFDRPRAEGKWSPGQAVEHLLLVERRTLRVLGGPVAGEADRRADEKCAVLDEVLRDGKALLKTGDAFDPAVGPRNRVELLDDFVDLRADLRVAAEFADDFGAVAKAFAHPRFGELTVCEWLYFSAVHGERHRRQFG